MSSQVVLIQGASRGIGLALVNEALASNPNLIVIATSRTRRSQDNLAKLTEKFGSRIIRIGLDLEREQSVKGASSKVRRITSQLAGIINVAGILHSKEIVPEKRVSDIQPRHFEKLIQINSLGPLLVAKWFSDLLAKTSKSYFINISAKVGSITDNQLGGWYSYRTSKAALNMITRNLSIELKRSRPEIICTAIHPGTTDTALSKPFQRNVPRDQLSSPEQTARRLVRLITSLDSRHNGKFLSTDGIEISW